MSSSLTYAQLYTVCSICTIPHSGYGHRSLDHAGEDAGAIGVGKASDVVDVIVVDVVL